MRKRKLLFLASLMSLVLASCNASELLSKFFGLNSQTNETNENNSSSENQNSENQNQQNGNGSENQNNGNTQGTGGEGGEGGNTQVDTYTVIETFNKRMPAEFEPCAMVKMCYPNNMPLSAYKEIAKDNKILLLVNPFKNGSSRISSARNTLQDAGVNIDNVKFLDMPIDDPSDDAFFWVRDFSPFYVFDKFNLTVVDFDYNRPDRTEQNAVPIKLANYFGYSYSKMSLTHTGGNLMQDGRGTAFSDDLVVSENNNNKINVLNQMKTYTGTDRYVITIDPQGDYIAHVDCWAKIVAPDKIIVARLPQSNSRYQYYEKVATELGNTKCVYGYNYKIYRVDEPGGKTVAPYTNSLIANNHVYMPLGSNPSYNEKALDVYKEALPGYEVVGVEGFSSSEDNSFLNTDALHCRTHEVPDKDMLFIDSREVLNGTVEYKTDYLVKTNIVSYSQSEVKDENVNIYYSVNGAAYQKVGMTRYKETTNFTFNFTDLKSGDDVKYYIEAKDENSKIAVDPTCGQLDPHHFVVT